MSCHFSIVSDYLTSLNIMLLKSFIRFTLYFLYPESTLCHLLCTVVCDFCLTLVLLKISILLFNIVSVVLVTYFILSLQPYKNL